MTLHQWLASYIAYRLEKIVKPEASNSMSLSFTSAPKLIEASELKSVNELIHELQALASENSEKIISECVRLSMECCASANPLIKKYLDLPLELLKFKPHFHAFEQGVEIEIVRPNVREYRNKFISILIKQFFYVLIERINFEKQMPSEQIESQAFLSLNRLLLEKLNELEKTQDISIILDNTTNSLRAFESLLMRKPKVQEICLKVINEIEKNCKLLFGFEEDEKERQENTLTSNMDSSDVMSHGTASSHNSLMMNPLETGLYFSKTNLSGSLSFEPSSSTLSMVSSTLSSITDSHHRLSDETKKNQPAVSGNQ